MKKRLLSLVLCLVMVFSLFPTFAVPAAAADGDVPETENLAPDAASGGGLTLNKSAAKDETHNTYSLTLTARANEQVIEQPQSDTTPTDIVFVVDQSYQMQNGNKLDGDYLSLQQERWTMDELADLVRKGQSNGDTYYYYDEALGSYYPISVAQGTMDYAEYYDSTDTGLWNELIPTDFDNWTVTGKWTYGVTDYQIYNPDTNSLTPLMVRTEGYVTGAAVVDWSCEYGSGGYHAVFFYLKNTDGFDTSVGAKTQEWYDSLGADNRVTVAYSDGKTQHDYARTILSVGTGSIDGVKKGLGSSIYYPADADHVALTNQNKYMNYTVGTETKTAFTAHYRDEEYRGKIYKQVKIKTKMMGSVQNSLLDLVSSIATDAADTNRDHRVSVVGFAGNEDVSLGNSTGDRINANNTNRCLYDNTGIFTGGSFVNYKTEYVTDTSAVAKTSGWNPGNQSLWVNSVSGYTTVYRLFHVTQVNEEISDSLVGVDYRNVLAQNRIVRQDRSLLKYGNRNWHAIDYGYVLRNLDVNSGRYLVNWTENVQSTVGASMTQPPAFTLSNSKSFSNGPGSANDNVNDYYHWTTSANNKFAELKLRDLTPAQYQASLVSANSNSNTTKNYINAFSGYGVTSDPALGLTMAKNVFANSGASSSDRNRIVVLITNGAPRLSGTINTVNTTLANNAKNVAKSLKYDDNAAIYAINLVQGNASGVESFMKEVSSQYYPMSGADGNQTNVHNDGSNYYANPRNMQQLEDAIASIFSRIEQPAKEAKVVDLTVTDYINTEAFDVSNATATANIPGATVSIEKNASSPNYGKITVTGADFSGENTLTVNITGLKAIKSGLQYTNLAASGVYGPDGKLALAFPRPAVEISEPEHEGGLDSNKTIDYAGGGKYTITMDAWATGNVVKTDPITIEKAAPVDIVLVVDQSGSMATRDMGTVYDELEDDWTIDMVTSGVQYYYYDGSRYYPVQTQSGPVYEKVDGKVTPSHSVGWDDEGVSFALNGSPTYFSVPTDYYVKYNNEMHKLYLITVARELHYSLYPYIYIDESTAPAEWHDNIYWALIWRASNLKRSTKWSQQINNIAFVNADGKPTSNSDADGDSVEKKYTWVSDSGTIANLYRLSDTAQANRLYYVDASGTHHDLGNQVLMADDVAYSGKLWIPNSERSRLDVMKEAVNDFIDTVASETEGSRMSIVGFAGNKVPARSSGMTAVNDTTTKFDYTDTGVFVNGGFKNYQGVGTASSDFTAYNGARYVNQHYYVKNGSAFQPVRYSASAGVWYNIVTNREVSGSTQFYKPNYTNLTAADYQASMLDVDTSAAALHSEVANFGAYGGTYSSYGMTMANRILSSTDAASNGNRKVIIVFTDGEPGGSGYEASIAGEALMDGNRSKLANGATVYTVGLFPGNVSSQVESFMRQLSSEYTVDKTEVYGGELGSANFNYGLGSGASALKGSETYYYINENPDSPDYQKTFAVNAIYNGKSSLGWWIYNSDGSYSLTTPKTNSGAGETEFRLNSQRVTADKVKTNTVYYTTGGQQIVYEYRWFDSNNNIVNPKTGSGDTSENHRQFYALGVPMADSDGETYYMRATDADSLALVFQTISETLTSSEDIPGTSVTYGADNSYLVDEISEYFDVPADFETNPTAYISAYTVPTTMAQDGTVTLGTTETPLPNPEITVEGKKLFVSNFDYAMNYCAYGDPGREGKALRVKVTGLTPKQTGLIPSNTSDSGVFALNEDGKLVMVEQFDPPTILVPGYTVRWADYDETMLEEDLDLLYGSSAAFDGGLPSREPEKRDGYTYTYTLIGWNTDKNASTASVALGDSVTVTEDATYYAIYSVTQERADFTVNWKDYDGGAISNDDAIAQETAAGSDVPAYKASSPVRDGYTFVGWSQTMNAAFDGDPEHYILTDTVASYDAQDGSTDGVATFYAVYVENTFDTKFYTFEYGMKHRLDSGVSEFDVQASPGGDFAIEDDTARYLTFTPNFGISKSIVDLTPLAGVNRVVYEKPDGFAMKTVDCTIVPASNVYLDDSLREADPAQLDVSSAFAYKAVLNQTDVNVDADQIEGGAQLSFTFTGTGIEVYAHTNSTSGKVGAYLYQGDKIIKSQITNNNSEGLDLYNVPTIRFDVDYGTYTLVIIPNKNADYRLDGVRVFNPADQGVQHLNIRRELLKQYQNDTNVFGALYLVDHDGVAQAADYELLGPKNEVYLDAGKSVAFQVVGWTGGTYRIGMGAVNGQTVAVAVSNGADDPTEHTVRGKTHMFYEVVPSDGRIVITNHSQTEGTILSITDLEIVGGEAAQVQDPELTTQAVQGPKFAVTRSLMSYVRTFDADSAQPLPEQEIPAPATPAPTTDPTPAPTTEPTPNPTKTPSIRDIVQQILSSFVSSLFKSISRLFGN